MSGFYDGEEEYGDHGQAVGQALPIAESPKAVLFELNGLEEWFPKSQIHPESEVWKFGQERGELRISTWLAKKREL